MLSCQRCKQATNGPQAFLLTCRGCDKTWHHRCHMPPVEDEELIRRIRATKAGDTTSGNDLRGWTCRRCGKMGLSGTSSAVASREPTAASESRENTNGSSSSSLHVTTLTDTGTTTGATSTLDVGVKQESSTATVDVRLANDREQNDKSGLKQATKAAPVKHTLIVAKRTKPSTASQSHVQSQRVSTQPREAEVRITDVRSTKLTPQEEEKISPQDADSRRSVSVVSATSCEDDIEMKIDILPSALSKSTSRASVTAYSDYQSIITGSIGESSLSVRAASSTSEQEQEQGPADGAVIQLQANQDENEVDDDPEDLYGPPVERRIVRILPLLAEELRGQQRRTVVEKEKRAPLAPDWILARYTRDPAWKEIPARTEGGRKRKPMARKLRDVDNANELLGYFTVGNWIREHSV